MVKKILLVDDEKTVLAALGTQIQLWGYDLITASNGKEAIAAVRKKKPHIVVLDYVMPEMDGLETLKRIRKINKKIPVIMFTAHPDNRSIRGTKKLGVASYIPKSCLYSEGEYSLKLALSMIEKRLDKKK